MTKLKFVALKPEANFRRYFTPTSPDCHCRYHVSMVVALSSVLMLPMVSSAHLLVDFNLPTTLALSLANRSAGDMAAGS